MPAVERNSGAEGQDPFAQTRGVNAQESVEDGSDVFSIAGPVPPTIPRESILTQMKFTARLPRTTVIKHFDKLARTISYEGFEEMIARRVSEGRNPRDLSEEFGSEEFPVDKPTATQWINDVSALVTNAVRITPKSQDTSVDIPAPVAQIPISYSAGDATQIDSPIDDKSSHPLAPAEAQVRSSESVEPAHTGQEKLFGANSNAAAPSLQETSSVISSEYTNPYVKGDDFDRWVGEPRMEGTRTVFTNQQIQAILRCSVVLLSQIGTVGKIPPRFPKDPLDLVGRLDGRDLLGQQIDTLRIVFIEEAIARLRNYWSMGKIPRGVSAQEQRIWNAVISIKARHLTIEQAEAMIRQHYIDILPVVQKNEHE